MAVASSKSEPRTLTPAELGMVIKILRLTRKWSQEQLAEISGLSTRTVQRTENGQKSGLDTLRALAIAFGAEDVDAFSKPHVIPTPEEVEAAQKEFDQQHVTLDALPLDSGRELAKLAETTMMDLSTPGFDMDPEADERFAALIDYMREYRDCFDLYKEADKLGVYEDFQGIIDTLSALGVSLRYAIRDIDLVMPDAPKPGPWKTSALYLVTFPAGKEPAQFATPRDVGIGRPQG